VSFNDKTAPPLKRPSGAACTTVPVTVEPEGIAVLPSTSTDVATVPEKACPDWLAFEPSVSPSRTVSTVPAGTTTGFEIAAFIFDIVDEDFEDVSDESGDLVSLSEAVSEGLLLQATMNNENVKARVSFVSLIIFLLPTLNR